MIVLRIVEALCLGAGILGFGYWIVLALAARRGRPAADTGREPAMAVLIPAHDEALTIGGILEDLRNQERPPGLVLVVADRCRDATADIARSRGAEVLVRTGTGGTKAEALAAGIDHLKERPWDALLVVDADCRIEPGFLRSCPVGSDAVWQTQVELRSEGTEPSIYPFWSRLENALFHKGRAALGLAAFLRGTGMFLGRDALARCPWRAGGLTEDRAQGMLFLRSGVPVRYLADRSVFTVPPQGLAEGWEQRRRWSSAGLARPLVDAVRTAAACRSWLGPRALELPLATVADARSLWILLLVGAAGLSFVTGTARWPALGLLLGTGAAAILTGFSWYGREFFGALVRLPSSAAVALGSAALSLFGHAPRGWKRSRR